MSKTHESIHYTHEVTVYVPCFYTMEVGYPGFTCDYSLATSDEQMALSMEPDYVLVLSGKFDAKTQPYLVEVEEYNKGVRNE